MMTFVKRFLFLLICILAVYALPWWLSLPLIFLTIILTRWFIEIVIVGIIFDSLYLSPFPHFPLFFSLILLLFLISVEYARTRVRI